MKWLFWQAAWTATLKQQLTEEAATDYGISTEDYLKAMDMHPSTEFMPRMRCPDPIEMDHMRAFVLANAREKAREKESFNHIRALNAAAYLRNSANHS